YLGVRDMNGDVLDVDGILGPLTAYALGRFNAAFAIEGTAKLATTGTLSGIAAFTVSFTDATSVTNSASIALAAGTPLAITTTGSNPIVNAINLALAAGPLS